MQGKTLYTCFWGKVLKLVQIFLLIQQVLCPGELRRSFRERPGPAGPRYLTNMAAECTSCLVLLLGHWSGAPRGQGPVGPCGDLFVSGSCSVFQLRPGPAIKTSEPGLQDPFELHASRYSRDLFICCSFIVYFIKSVLKIPSQFPESNTASSRLPQVQRTENSPENLTSVLSFDQSMRCFGSRWSRLWSRGLGEASSSSKRTILCLASLVVSVRSDRIRL